MSNAHTASIGGMPLTGNMAALAPARQAYHILHFAFAAAPISAGLDKFFPVLVNWDMYLAPWIARMSPVPVFAWLLGIIINLLTFPGFHDIALRDFGLSLGALALARLSLDFDRSRLAQPVAP